VTCTVAYSLDPYEPFRSLKLVWAGHSRAFLQSAYLGGGGGNDEEEEEEEEEEGEEEEGEATKRTRRQQRKRTGGSSSSSSCRWSAKRSRKSCA